MEKISKAEVGQIVEPKDIDGKMVVGLSCGGNKGQWYCVTHDQTFINQFYKDTHIEKGEHQMAWVCPEHGLEVP